MSKLNHAKVNRKERIAQETRNEYAADAHARACMRAAYPRTRKRRAGNKQNSFVLAHLSPDTRAALTQLTRKEHAS